MFTRELLTKNRFCIMIASQTIYGRVRLQASFTAVDGNHRINDSMDHTIVPFLRKQVSTSVLAGLVFAGLAFVAIISFGPRYSVRTDYLISQENAQTQDYYTLTRSAEYMSQVLTEVAGSERFISAVIDTGKVDQSFLPQDKSQRLAAWKRMVRVEKRLDLGIISVTISDDNLTEGQKVSLAVSQVFTEKNGILLGTGDHNVPVSILSGPIAERNPGLAKALIAVGSGFFGGFLASLLFAFLRAEFSLSRGTAFRRTE